MCCIDSCRYADMLWFYKQTLSYQKDFITTNICVNTNNIVIVARFDVPTVVVPLQLCLLSRVVGRVVTSVSNGNTVKQWTAWPWRWWNCVTTEQTCIFMIIVLFSLNYCCTGSLRCQQITTSRTHSGILMLCSNPNSILLVMHMTRFSFQVSFLLVCSFCNWSCVEPSSLKLDSKTKRITSYVWNLKILQQRC